MMMKFETIYKLTNGGKIQQWTIETEGNKYRTISGQTEGKKTTSSWTVCHGKNVGKSNETSDTEQAEKQAQAVFDKKLEGHYHRDIKKSAKAKFVKAMLAHKYDIFKGDFTDIYSQPKLDGIRCLITPDGMFSRGGKPIIAAPHIFKAIKDIFDAHPEIQAFDGELYTSALKDNFNKIVSLARKAKPTKEELEESAENLEYWVYDMVVENTEFYERWQHLYNLLCDRPGIVRVSTRQVFSQDDLDRLYAEYLADGQEGQMIRNGNSLYEGKRSKHLLKRKEFLDEEFKMTGIEEGIGNWAGYAKKVVCELANGTVFRAGIKGNQEYCEALLKRAYVNGEFAFPDCEVTVRYQNKTPDGIPRFPIAQAIHETERW
tara:strand:- start:3829 stop:4950 length:1122 start_codon:yes stop_codon:yes gene_type:complete